MSDILRQLKRLYIYFPIYITTTASAAPPGKRTAGPGKQELEGEDAEEKEKETKNLPFE